MKTFHPQLFELISLPDRGGYYCPICSHALKPKKDMEYDDWICEWTKSHIFKIYETLNKPISEEKLEYKYAIFSCTVLINNKLLNITMYLEEKALKINGKTVSYDFEFSSMQDLIERVETLLLFS